MSHIFVYDSVRNNYGRAYGDALASYLDLASGVANIAYGSQEAEYMFTIQDVTEQGTNILKRMIIKISEK